MRRFEDFIPGSSETYGPLPVTKEDILAFAREFDPQPFHTDEEAAKDSFLGRLVASGWHTCSLNMRLIAEGFLLDTLAMGAPGIEEVKWLKPVLPGDVLRTKATVVEGRVSRSRPDLGLVRFRFDVLNQDDEAVMSQANWIMIATRDARLPSEGKDRPSGRRGGDASKAASPAADPARPAKNAPPAPYLDDLVIGETTDLGSHTFMAEDIIRFAKAYDPQRFHVDPEAARRSLFGGLCASGWHTGSVWMKLMVAHRDAMAAEARRRGLPTAGFGPSPGFRDLKWGKPVYAGDTVAYSTTLVDKRFSASRPDWGLAFHRNRGVNQHGEEVLSFEGAVFWQRRR
jgi:acyl dehydratase